jgi:hypothetical protein
MDRVFIRKQISLLPPELNPSAQRCLPRFFLVILIFKGLTARRLYKLFGVKGLKLFVISGCSREVDRNCVFLGYYAESKR